MEVPQIFTGLLFTWGYLVNEENLNSTIRQTLGDSPVPPAFPPKDVKENIPLDSLR